LKKKAIASAPLGKQPRSQSLLFPIDSR